MPKFGKCPLCPKDSREKPLIGGYCPGHHSDSTPDIAPVELQQVADTTKEKKKTQKQWYDDQVKQIPKKCENCNGRISVPKDLPKSTPVAHILPKSKLKSVATHPLNRWFGCWQCHADYDNATPGEQSMMHVAAVCRERVAEFYHLVSDKELRHVPDWLKP